MDRNRMRVGLRWCKLGALGVLGLLLLGVRAAGGPDPTVSHLAGFVVLYDPASLQSWQAHPQAFATVYLDTGVITSQGAVIPGVPPELRRWLTAHPTSVCLTVSDIVPTLSETQLLERIWAHPRRVDRLAAQLAAAVRGSPFSGLNLDFEGNPPQDAAAFDRFLARLAPLLHREHRTLSVDVPAETTHTAAASGYNYAAIGRRADRVLVMAYDYSYPGSRPGPIAPLWWVGRILAYASQTVPADKLWLGLPAYAYDWSGHRASALTLSQVSRLLAAHPHSLHWNSRADAPYLRYRTGAGIHLLYYENAASLSAELRLTARRRWAGVFYWFVGAGTPRFFQILAGYRP